MDTGTLEGPSLNKISSLAPRRLCKRSNPAIGCSSTPGWKNNASYWNHIRMLIGTEFTTSQAPVVSAPDSTINILGGVDACPMKSRRIIMNTDRLTVPLIYLRWVQRKVKTACTLHNALSFDATLWLPCINGPHRINSGAWLNIKAKTCLARKLRRLFSHASADNGRVVLKVRCTLSSLLHQNCGYVSCD